jgi:hypothetical protein
MDVKELSIADFRLSIDDLETTKCGIAQTGLLASSLFN